MLGPKIAIVDKKIYIAGHRGMVGSAIVRRLHAAGYTNLVTRTHQELDLLDQQAVFDFLQTDVYKRQLPDWAPSEPITLPA